MTRIIRDPDAASVLIDHETRLATLENNNKNRQVTVRSVSTATIAANSINTTHVIDGSLTGADLADGTITFAKLAPGAIVVSDDSITGGSAGAGVKIKQETITSANILNRSLTGGDLALLTVTGAEIANDTITAAQIAADAVGTSELAPNAVTAAELADGSVDTLAIQSGAVTSAKVGFKVGGTNRVHNSGFEAGTSRWAQRGTGVTIAPETAITRSGDGAVRVTMGPTLQIDWGVAPPTAADLVEVRPGEQYVLTAYAQAVAAANGYVTILYRDATGAGLPGGLGVAHFQSTPVALSTTEFTRLRLVSVAPTGAFLATPVVGSNTANAVIIVDDVQVENGDVETAYGPRPDEVLPGAVDASAVGFKVGGFNFVPNSNFEFDPTLLFTLGTGTHWSMDTTRFRYGVRSVLVAPTVAASGFVGVQTLTFPVGDIAGEVVTLSADMLRSEGTGNFRLGVEFRDAAGASLGLSESVVSPAVDDVWDRVAFTTTPAPAGTMGARLRMYYTLYVAGVDQMNVDAIQLQIGDVATEYTPKADEVGVGSVTTAGLADNSVTSAKIVDGTITGADIALDTITAANLASGSVGQAELADLSVDTAAIIDGAVTSAKIANGTVTGADIALDTITAANLAADSVTASELADGSVDTAAIVDLAVATAKIQDNAVATAKIANNAVTSAKIANGTITGGSTATGDIAADTITAENIAPGAIGTSEIADNSVTSAKIVNATIVSADVALQTITGGLVGNLALGTVTQQNLANNSVGSAQIIDASVTGTDIATQTVTGGLIGNLALNTVATTNIADLAVSTAKIADLAVTTAKIADNSVTGAKFADNSITTVKIQDNAVTAAKARHSAYFVEDPQFFYNPTSWTQAAPTDGWAVTNNQAVHTGVGATTGRRTFLNPKITDVAGLEVFHVSAFVLRTGPDIPVIDPVPEIMLRQFNANGSITDTWLPLTTPSNPDLGSGSGSTAQANTFEVTCPPLFATTNRVQFGITMNGNTGETWAWDRVRIVNQALTDHLADRAITTAKIALDAIDDTLIAANAILTEHLANAQVTVEKLASNAVGTAQIAADSITIDKIAANAVGTIEMVDRSVSSIKIAVGAILVEHVSSALYTDLDSRYLNHSGDTTSGNYIFTSSTDGAVQFNGGAADGTTFLYANIASVQRMRLQRDGSARFGGALTVHNGDALGAATATISATGALTLASTLTAGGLVSANAGLTVEGLLIAGGTGNTGDVLRLGNDLKVVDVNVANQIALYGIADPSQATLQFGNSVAGWRLTGTAAGAGTVTGTLNTTGNLSENGNRVYTSANANLATATPPAIAATGAVGVGTAYARTDHTHSGVTTLAVTNNASVNAANGAVTITNSLSPTFTTATIGVTTVGATNTLDFANPGVGGTQQFRFLRATDTAGIRVTESAADLIKYEFYISDNPDSGDYFSWFFTDHQGPGAAWQPLYIGGIVSDYQARLHNFRGNVTLDSNWYSGVDGRPATINKIGTGTLTATPNVSAFTGSTRAYWIKIDGTGTPNTFSWGVGSTVTAPLATLVPITGTAQTLDTGVTVTFNATTGGVLNDLYQFRTYSGGVLTVPGYIDIERGTATSPPLRFTPAGDSGVWSPGADQVALTTGGATRLLASNTGVVVTGTLNSTGNLSENGNRVYTSANANLATATPNAVAAAGSVGVGTAYARTDHAHAGVATLAVANNASISGSTGALTITNSLTPAFTTMTSAAATVNGATTAREFVTSLNTTNSGSGGANQWQRLCTATVTAQFGDAQTEITMIQSGDGSTVESYATVLFRVKQQAAFGSNPLIDLVLFDSRGNITLGQFVALIEQNTPTTVVSLWFQTTPTFQGFAVFPRQRTSSGTFTWYPAGDTLLAAIPAGTQTAAVWASVNAATVSTTGNITENGNRVYSAANANLASLTPTAIAATGAVGVGTAYARTDHTHSGVLSVATRQGAVTLTAADIAAGTFPAGTFNFSGTLQAGGSQVYTAAFPPPATTWTNLTGKPSWLNTTNLTLALTTTDNPGVTTTLPSGHFTINNGATTTFVPSAQQWHHVMQNRHSDTGNNYAMQLSMSLFSADRNLYIRQIDNAVASPWYKVYSTYSGIAGTDITANTITANQVNATVITSAVMQASQAITVGVLGGNRVEITATNGIRGINGGVTKFQVDNAGNATFSGNVSAATITGGTISATKFNGVAILANALKLGFRVA